MTKGTEIKCKDDKEMLDVMRTIRRLGGEVMCTDYEKKILLVVKGCYYG